MHVRHHHRLLAAMLTIGMASMPGASVAQTKASAATVRPINWGVPVPLEGAPNLHRITPDFYRSAQPLKAGFPSLERQVGIKTVVSLRAFHSDKKLAAGTGIKLISIPINTWNIEREDLVRALAEIEIARKKGPVLLHCQHGADRTGLVSALYRMLYEGWTREAALDEMRNGKFGYHAVWGNIPRFIEKVDVEALRRDVAAKVKALG
jgi:protein tyrosine/serine phosphatase